MKSLGGAARLSVFFRAGFVGSLILASLALAGCADVRSVPPSPTGTDTAAPTPTATLPIAMTPAQAKAAYKSIAQNSCRLAQADGVVEVGEGYTAVMTNSTQAYQGFNEALLITPDAYSVLFSLSDFNSCADWFIFSMADEAGKAAPIDVTFNTDASFNVQKVLASGKTSKLRIVVADGLIATITDLIETSKPIIGCRHGSLTEADLAIVKTAVDRRTAGK